ncbi:MAG TPA: hypothetical protein VGJ13_04840 [Pseudonocardiaceae bacterium]|jgi:hypothetical protein
MSDPFAIPTVEFHDDPRLENGGEWPASPEPEPTAAEPAAEQVAPSVAPTSGARGWLATQPWYAQPQQAFTDLKLDARHGDWTINSYVRAARIAWVHIPARLARIRAWSVLRLWMRADAPRFSEPQPPLSAVVAQARESWADLAFACVYIPARVWSIWADYAGRMAIVAGLIALGITALAGPGWWWDQISGLWASFGNSAPGGLPHAAPTAVPAPVSHAAAPPQPSSSTPAAPGVFASVLQLLLIALAAVFGVRRWIRSRDKRRNAQRRDGVLRDLVAHMNADNDSRRRSWRREGSDR